MDPSRFALSPAGRVVRAGPAEAAYWAFVPNPLPPALTFDASLARALSDADRAIGELSGLGRMLPNPHLLVQPFIRKEAVLSSRIEGTQTDIADLYVLEAAPARFGPRGTAREADAHEVLNYVRALEYGLDRLHSLPVSLRFMRELHERLMRGVRGDKATPGEFRRSQNWIGPAGSAVGNAPFVPPPPSDMHDALNLLETYIHTDAEDRLPPLIRIALIHYQFEAIHPFLDGNGRIGRLLISVLLVHWELLALPMLYLSAYFERHRGQYGDRLLAVSETGAWREWLLFFLRGVIEQAKDATQRVKRLQDLQQSWRTRLTQARSSALALRLADSLLEHPVLTIPRARDVLGVTYRSALLTVGKLERSGILTAVDESSYGKRFRADEILRVISD